MTRIYCMLFVAFLFLSCEKETEPVKYFSKEHLNKLNLDSLNQFWDEGEQVVSWDGCGPDKYKTELNTCIDGLTVWNNEKMVWVNVFTTREAAIEAMEYRISKVAAHIVEGKVHGFTDKWWIEEGSKDPSIFVNKWNTIIELLYLVPPTYEIGDRLYISALEIANRIDSLSVLRTGE